jgi:hypothetical protein
MWEECPRVQVYIRLAVCNNGRVFLHPCCLKLKRDMTDDQGVSLKLFKKISGSSKCLICQIEYVGDYHKRLRAGLMSPLVAIIVTMWDV